MTSDRHVSQEHKEKTWRTISLLPAPSPAMEQAVDRLVLDVHRQFGLSAHELNKRRQATDRLKNFIETNFAGFTVRLYGSCFTGNDIHRSVDRSSN